MGRDHERGPIKSIDQSINQSITKPSASDVSMNNCVCGEMNDRKM